MTVETLVAAYRADAAIQLVARWLKDGQKARLKGVLPGGHLAFVVAGVVQATAERPPWVVVVSEREAAAALVNDLALVLPQVRVWLFPSSARRPYQLENIDNANVLQRSEVLNVLNHTDAAGAILVTYPEALSEKVVSRKAFASNTLDVAVGEKPGLDVVVHTLESYGYVREHFVRRPGEFAVRGGLVDVFSFAYEHPYRMEFLDDEIVALRVFDPDSQLSTGTVDRATFFPDFNTGLQLQEDRVSLLEFIAPTSRILIQDASLACQELDALFGRAATHYARRQSQTGGATPVSEPHRLHLTAADFRAQLARFSVAELGTGSEFHGDLVAEFQASGQPVFKKDFNLLAQNLVANHEAGISNFIFCENDRQVRRLKEIFVQTNARVRFEGIPAGLSRGFVDHRLAIACYTDHQIFERFHRVRQKALQATHSLTLRELLQLQPGDFVTHTTHGIGRFAGLEKIKVGEHEQEAIKIIFKDGDMIHVNVNSLDKISKYSGKEGTHPPLSKLGSGEWSRTKARVKKRVKELAFDLIQLYARRKAMPGFAFSPDSYLQQELEASFLYEDTPDQLKTTAEVKADLEKPHPMDRLVCGDVGFGKTEIAIRAAFKVATDGKQVAVLVPTTILAMQHYHTFTERLGKFPVTIDYINRFRTKKEQKETLHKLQNGQVDIIVGTHRLLSKDVVFKDLGLIIIDEEHKFGVGDKEKLRVLRSTVDTLALTATPIPRTLQFSLLGIRDFSVISTPPPNRQPVDTIIEVFDPAVIRDAVAYELSRNGQVYYIHNRVKDLEEIGALIKQLVPDARVAIAHGQQEAEAIEETMLRFIDHKFDVLVCTTIVESGLDIPNANTIIISQAHTYGLSVLHQMRGRVGRSNRKAFCYLLAPPQHILTTDARKRLQAIEEFSDLGSGFQISMRDMDIRGAGDILGKEQSGFIADIGYDTYHKLLDEAIQELLDENPDELAPLLENSPHRRKVGAGDCHVDTDLQVLIPDTYIANTAERLDFYKRISEAQTEADLQALLRELRDRFGLVPTPVFDLFDTVRIREAAKRVGFEKVTFIDGKLRCTFISDPAHGFFRTPVFEAVLAYCQENGKKVLLKQNGKHLQLQRAGLRTLKEAWFAVKELADFVAERTAPVGVLAPGAGESGT